MKALKLLTYMKASINNEDGHEDFEAMSDDELKAYLDEAIAELEALQQRSCQNCKHWKVRNTLVVSNECFRWSGNVMTPKDFCCNRYEPKEQ